MADLGAFLANAATRRREPGAWDCCAFPAAWALEAGCSDPMAAWRNEYSTEAEAEAFIFDADGLDKLFAQGMAEAGIPEASEPYEAGDIAVVRLLEQEAGAVFTGRRWAFVADRGLAFVSLDPGDILKAWRPANG